jgi:hypothetical protein
MKFVAATLAALLLLALAARAQPTAFTYQGRLNNGTNPASGSYDFQFQIYNAGSVVVAGPLTNAPVAVSNGLFTVALDFGGPVFNGGALTLEIGVRTNGSAGAYAILSPRQPILSVPYAVQSLNASNAMTLTAPLQATNIAGTIPDAQLSTNVPLRNGNQTFTGANSFTGAVTATNPANVFAGAFSGNGIGLTSLSTTNLIGTLPDARLSTNVPLRNANQTFGGANVFTGAVTANNASNVFTGAFTGSGHGLTNVPGAFFWVTISGTNATASSNVGFILTNNVTPVTIALPPAPTVGDVFRLAGVGSAGWILTQMTNQTILAGNLTVSTNWTAHDSNRNWSAVASSSDGTDLVATENHGQIYTSSDSGQTWTAQKASGLGALYWSSVASSGDGTKLVAAVGYTTYDVSQTGNIYTSIDSGGHWTLKLGSASWASVASSSDGTKLVAAARTGQIYTSINSGGAWTARDSNRLWTAVASSADGTKLAAAVDLNSIYISTNSGVSWTASAGSPNLHWTSLSSSADGSRLVAVANPGQIYISPDAGTTWVASTPEFSVAWTSVASSSDGSHLAATYTGPGYVYSSTDSGTTWATRAPNLSWMGIASSADGGKLVIVANNGQIYTFSQSSTTAGTAGYLSGAGQSAIELNYVGNGIFMPLNHEGTIRAY